MRDLLIQSFNLENKSLNPSSIIYIISLTIVIILLLFNQQSFKSIKNNMLLYTMLYINLLLLYPDIQAILMDIISDTKNSWKFEKQSALVFIIMMLGFVVILAGIYLSFEYNRFNQVIGEQRISNFISEYKERNVYLSSFSFFIWSWLTIPELFLSNSISKIKKILILINIIFYNSNKYPNLSNMFQDKSQVVSLLIILLSTNYYERDDARLCLRLIIFCFETNSGFGSTIHMTAIVGYIIYNVRNLTWINIIQVCSAINYLFFDSMTKNGLLDFKHYLTQMRPQPNFDYKTFRDHSHTHKFNELFLHKYWLICEMSLLSEIDLL